MNFFTERWKAIVALLGGILAWAQSSWADGSSINREEWIALGFVLLTALGVERVKNST